MACTFDQPLMKIARSFAPGIEKLLLALTRRIGVS
jgi:hypothetical protein